MCVCVCGSGHGTVVMAVMKAALASRQEENTKRKTKKNLEAEVGWWKNIKDV